MGETLFIAHRIPFPPDRGDKIRSHHLLKALASLGPVHVATFGETAADFAAEAQLAELAASHCLVKRSASLAPAAVRALLSGKPVSQTAFASDHLRGWIARTIAQRPIDSIFVFSGQMGQYIPPSFDGRVVIDLCDVDSAKFDAYARDSSAPRAWLYAREGRLMAREEARLAARADATLLISDAEAALFRRRLRGSEVDLVTVGNGIDTALFDPAAVRPHADLTGASGPQIVFTGQMDYPPNVSAARRAAETIMPRIRSVHPAARFHVVGRAPAADVLKLEGTHGTRVWGEVPDVRPFLAAADLVLAPLSIARGVQNKVLEAMAMARPVVLTPEAAAGIGAQDGAELAVAESDEALASAALELLEDTARAQTMGRNARAFTVAHKSWHAALAPLPALMASGSTVRDAA